jgi:hypothetical protein
MTRFHVLTLLSVAALGLAASSPAPAQTAGKAKSYCYKTAESTLRLDVGSKGQAAFQFASWQGGGHSCGGGGTAAPMAGGWVYEAELAGGPCRMEFLISDGGIRLTDADWRCKATLCGQRAVIDELTFPRSSQVACASAPAQ